MTITLSPELERKLKVEASRRGMDADAFAAKLVEDALLAPPARDTTLALLDQWDAEEATDDPQKIAEEQREAEDFMRSLAASRIEMEGQNARKLWP